MSTDQSKAIVAELNGQAKILESDFPENKGPKVDPLEVTSLPQSAIQRHDSQFATRSGGKGYAVTVRGLYYRPNPLSVGVSKTERKEYQVTVNVPKLEGALSIIKKHLLIPAILRFDSTATGVQTHKIVETRPLSAETPESRNIQYMTREALVAHIEHDAIPIDHTLPQYQDAVVLRDSVVDYTHNPEGFEAREAERAAKRKEHEDLLALNPELGEAKVEAKLEL